MSVTPATPRASATPPQELDFLASRVRILASGGDGQDRLGLVDMVVPAGDMPPLHVHHTEDEGFYVTEGEITLYMPGEERRLEAGDFLLAPRGVPHTYRVGEAGTRLLVTSTPAGFERFVADVAALAEVDPETLTAVAARHDIEILGPPGMLP